MNLVGTAHCLILACVAASLAFQKCHAKEPADVRARKRGLAQFREEFELINRSTDLLGWDEPDPVSLVRAVNHLRSRGRERAIEVFRAYMRYARVNAKAAGRPHAPDEQRLCWIIPLLFVPAEENADLPSLGRDPAVGASKTWKPFDISVIGDLPFHIVEIIFRTGSPEPDRGYLVEWAAEHARLRDNPLRPVDDPIQAADELCNQIAQEDEFLRMHIRRQARRSIDRLLPRAHQQSQSPWLLDEDWKSLKRAASKIKFRWDEVEQKYTANDSR